jgi:chemotaxis family two-component system response regulator Rcp1
MIDAAGWPPGVGLKDDPTVRAAHIVVIDDNVSDVFLLRRALNQQHLQFELVHLPNGGDALAYIRKQAPYANVAPPDLMVIDLNLSKYTGEDILRAARDAPDLQGVPVCVWSSSAARRDRAMLQDLGVSQFITKPSGLDKFMEIGKVIKDVLTRNVG